MMEKCSKCGREFEDDCHFVRCDEDDCPEKSEKSILDILFGDEE